MRVAVVTESFLPTVNGVTHSVMKVLETLKTNAHDALVIAPTTVSSTYLGFPVVTCPSIPLVGFPVAIPTPAIGQALDAFRPDVLHVAAPFWLGSQALSYGARKAIASVAVYQTHVAGYMERYGLTFATSLLGAVTAATHKSATLNLAPTIESKAYLESMGVPRVEVWGRGVDGELFTPRRRAQQGAFSLRQRWAAPGHRIIGYVGRLAPEKQVSRIREVCGIPGTQVVIVGDGPNRRELEVAFRDHNVVFAGRLTGEELADAYAAMDIFVHCGTEETFGQTIQEAQAAGVAVVAPNRGGPRHLIRDSHTGYLVDSSRWGAFREKVLHLLEHPEERNRMSRNAREAVKGKTWQKNNEELLAYYSQARDTMQTREPLAA